MANSRVARGRRTQVVLAARWADSGLFPKARAVYGTEPGRDVKNTPGFSVECKARRDFNPLAWVKQSAKNAGDDYPIVVMRPDGLGEERVDQWLVFMSVDTFEDIVLRLQEVSHCTEH